MAGKDIGKVLGIALRTAARGPMKEVTTVFGFAGRGLEGDVEATCERGITFISAQQWAETTRDLGTILMWHSRRANVLIDGGNLEPLIGQEVRLGELTIHIHGETHPCALMDEIRPGLRAALTPDCRGGVHGAILKGGSFSVGDMLTLDTP